MYQNSPEHLNNLFIARTQLNNKKFKCQHCSEERNKANITKHEKGCYLNPLNIKLCPVCDQPIKNYKENTTCSYVCSNKKFRTGPNHGNWKEDRYQTTCFHYHEKKCVICQETNIIDVHHFDENHANNTPTNLIPLCPTHHKYWHSHFKYLVEDKIVQYHYEFGQGIRRCPGLPAFQGRE